MQKNIGIIKKFDLGERKRGFVQILFQCQSANLSEQGDIYLSLSHVLNDSPTPHKGDFVKFDIVNDFGRESVAANAKVIDKNELIEEVNFSVAVNFKKFCKKFYFFDSKMLQKFLNSLPTTFYKYSWVFAEISRHIKPEKFKTFAKEHFTKLNDEEIIGCIDELLNHKSVSKIIEVLKVTFDAAKVKTILKNCSESYMNNSQKLANYIFNSDEIFPTETIVKLFPKAGVNSRLIAFEKYLDKFSNEEIISCVDTILYFKEPNEIVEVLSKFFDSEKIRTILKNCAESHIPNSKKLANYIFISDEIFPTEMIVKLFPKADESNQFIAFEKYLDKFSNEEIIYCVKEFLKVNEFLFDVYTNEKISALKLESIKKLVPIIKLKRPNDWSTIPTECINDKTNTLEWAEYLLEEIETFRQVNVNNDCLILLMYAAAQKNKISAELVSIIEEKLRNERALLVMTVYYYFRAGYEHNDDYLDKADDNVSKIFQAISKQPSRLEELFQKFEELNANIFKPCNKPYSVRHFGDKEIKCFFCESVTSPKNDYDYCPRTGYLASSQCGTKHHPNLNLHFKDWSLVELAAYFKLNLDAKYLEKNTEESSEEYFSRLGGEFNRLYELRDRLKCRGCGEYMRSNKYYAKWKENTRVRDLLKDIHYNKINHFAIFNSTMFSCQNPNCSSPDEAYISYCWHCQEIIDSREGTAQINGWYLCPHCGAGYYDDRKCEKCGNTTSFKPLRENGKLAHYVCQHCDSKVDPVLAIFPGTICPSCTTCPSCGGKFFTIVKKAKDKVALMCGKEIEDESGEKNIIMGCGYIMPLKRKFKKFGDSKNQFQCNSCQKIVKVNLSRLEKDATKAEMPFDWIDEDIPF